MTPGKGKEGEGRERRRRKYWGGEEGRGKEEDSKHSKFATTDYYYWGE